MPDIIRLLPEALANQIAAGEVVQRPASVIKELLENAIDAKATEIKLIIREAGKTLIQVIDNGHGMSETDARMSFERHATSKISKTEDLFNIMTMGFRGEALASIAAVAQVDLKTKREEDEIGICIKIEGSQIKESTLTASPKGTSISVKNLFFNVPARRNFLKSNPVEFRHIYDEYMRVALAHPEIAFSFYNNDEDVSILNGTKLVQRIVSLMGNSYKDQLAVCKEETQMMNIYGYIGKPDLARKSRGEQFFFANKRFIRHPYLHHAVSEAYEGLIDDNAHPFYVLFIEIEPKHIDINVHPTKTEIKFDDERTVYGIVKSAVKKAISAFNLSVDLDFNENVNVDIFSTFRRTNTASAPFENKSTFNFQERLSNEQKNLENWKSLYEGMEKNLTDQRRMIETVENPTMELRFQSAANRETESHEVSRTEIQGDLSIIFQIHNSYIVSQVRSGMMMIDQQAAHERVLYDKFISTLEKKFGASQQFLFPLSIELNPADFVLVTELETEIHALGFSFSIFGKNTIVINGVPSDVRSGNEKALFEGFLEQFKRNRSDLRLTDHENLARSLAKKSAIKKGAKLTHHEMVSLVEQLLSSPNPSFAPDGNHTIVILDMNKLQTMFQG
jgi:DNA mismatch repair protein MutL